MLRDCLKSEVKMATDIAYPDEFIDRLEVVWGEGFLSPGGADEVVEILPKFLSF